MAASEAPIKSLEVQVEAQANSAVAALQELENHLTKVAQKLASMSGDVKALSGLSTAINKIAKATESASKSSSKKVAPKVDYSQFKDMSLLLDEIEKKVGRGFGKNVPINEMDNFAGYMKETSKQIDVAEQKLKDLMAAGAGSDAIEQAATELVQLQNGFAAAADEAERVNAEADRLAKGSFTPGLDDMQTNGSPETWANEMAQATAEAEGYANSERDIAAEARDAVIAARSLNKEISVPIQKSGWTMFLEDLREVTPVMKKIMSVTGQVGKSVASGAAKMAKAIIHPIKAVKQLGNGLRSLLGIEKRSGGLLRGRSLGQFIGLIAFRRAITAAIRALTSGIKEGSDNLTHYSAEYNKSISSMVSSLNYLKNAWAAAFAPIVNVVAPYISAFIDMLASVLNAIGRFMAVLTGKGFAVQAVKGWTNVAAASDKAAGSAGKAAKAAEEYKRTIMSFDELHVLNAPDDGSGSGGSGGGGGSGKATDYNSMFTTVAVDTEEGLAAALREAYEAGDFEEIGNLIAEAIATSLDKLNWKNIEAKASSVASKLASTINGFVGNDHFWSSLGKTIGGMINTATGTVSTFFNKTDFKKLGNQVASSVKTAIETVKADQIGSAIYGVINSGIDFSYGFITQGVKDGTFAALGEKIGTAISDAIGGIHWDNLGGAIGNAITALFTFIGSLLGTTDFLSLGSGIKTAFSHALYGIKWETISVAVYNALNGLCDFILGLVPTSAEWESIGKKIGDGIWNGLFSAFNDPAASNVLMDKLYLIMTRLVIGLDAMIWNLLPISQEMPYQTPKWLSDLESKWQRNLEYDEQQLAANKELADSADNASKKGKKYAESAASVRKNQRNANKELKEAKGLYAKAGDSASKASADTLSALNKTSEKVKNAASEWFSMGSKSGAKYVEGQSKELQKSTSTVQGIIKGFTAGIGDKSGTESGAQFVSAFNASLDPIRSTDIKVGIIGNVTQKFKDMMAEYDKAQNKEVTATGKGKQDSSFEFFSDPNKNWTAKAKDKIVTATGKGKQDSTFTFFTDKNKNWRKYAADKIVNAIAYGNPAQTFIDLYREYTSLVNKKITVTAEAMANQVRMFFNIIGNAHGGILMANGWQPIQGYASGGLVTAEHFIARENGMPELVGRIGTHTAVMNNDQIVSSVANGVYRATVAAMNDSGRNNSTIPYQLNVTVKTQNDEVLARAVQRGNASRNYRANAFA